MTSNQSSVGYDQSNLVELGPVVDDDGNLLNGNTPAVTIGRFSTTDVGNSNRLVAKYGAVLRYVPKWHTWLHYDGIRWAETSQEFVMGLAKQVLTDMKVEALAMLNDPDKEAEAHLLGAWAYASEKGRHLGEMVEYAKPDVLASPDDFDRNPDLLNMLDGTFDFRTGEVREHRATDMISKVTGAAYGDGTDDHRMFAQFIEDITDGNVGLAVYIQQVLGLAMSGDRTVKHVWFPHGNGDNGKTLLFELTGDVMGEYAGIGQNSDIIDHGKYNTSKPFGLFNLVGKRRAVFAEIGKEDRLNWSVLKTISGSDTTNVEKKMNQAVSVQLECKVFIYVNELPTIEQVGEAEWSRIRVIPFPRCWNVDRPECDKPDQYLGQKLRAHKSAVLRWLVHGEMLRREFGLIEPAIVTEATELYRKDNDPITDFLKERTRHAAATVRTKGQDLFSIYTDWYQGPFSGKLDPATFGRLLTNKGYTSKRSNGATWYYGIERNDVETFNEKMSRERGWPSPNDPDSDPD